ncbi:hypothetical protein [Carboxylicivirga sp. RSCT41]|uniref:hypothetical protein n=1 Tax=Carboxylicivirga agarovorans TaxID=3417570 RepID=UPI003D32E35E
MLKHCVFFLLSCIVFQGCCLFCFEEEDYKNGSDYEPVYLFKSELDQFIQLRTPQGISNSGKIYVIGDLLFVGEEREGFHIFDNSDPKHPEKMFFLQVPGASDLAIRNNVMYINQATDLVAIQFDLASEAIKITKRIENTFPELRSPDGFVAYDIPEAGVVVKWIPKK